MAPIKNVKSSRRRYTPYSISRSATNKLTQFIKEEKIIPQLKNLFRRVYGKNYGLNFKEYFEHALSTAQWKGKNTVELFKIADIITFCEFHIARPKMSRSAIDEFVLDKVYEFDLRTSEQGDTNIEKYYYFIAQVIMTLLDSVLLDFEDELSEALDKLIPEIDREIKLLHANAHAVNDIDDLISSMNSL